MTPIEKCPMCKGYLWLCEKHPDTPWNGGCPHENCYGPGMNCECNPNGELGPEMRPVCWVGMGEEEPKPKTEWSAQEVFVVFIHKIYEEAGLTIPDDFYPEDEAPRVARSLRAQGLGIKLEDGHDAD